MRTTERPSLQDFHIEGVKHINPSDALEVLKNDEAVLLDVREINEVKLESVPLDRVINYPMSVIMDRLYYIAKDQNIIVACPGGVRRAKVANLLLLQEYPNVANLDGGSMMWKANGLPYDSSISSEGCGCNSGTQSKSEFTSLKLDPGENLSKNIDFKNLRRI